MKVALLISGLPRYVDKGYPNIYSSLIEPNNPDIFIHTWKDVDGTCNEQVEQLYKPLSIRVEDQQSWANSRLVLDRMMSSHARSYHRNQFVTMLYASWYSIQEANLLKERYRLKNDMTYDYVIRARFDIWYSKPIVCSSYDQDVLHVSNKWLPDTEMVDDRFGFGSNDIMNAYACGFNIMDKIQQNRESKDGIFCGETLVYEICKLMSIANRQVKDLTANNISHMITQGLI